MSQKIKLKRSELEKMSQEELLQVVRHSEDLRKANEYQKQEKYLANAHEGQIEFHKSGYRIRWGLAGNRGGKSTGGCNEGIWLANGTHPFRKIRVPNKGLIVIPDFENHGKNILEPKLNEWLNWDRDVRHVERHQGGAIKKIYLKIGSTIDVLSHDQKPIVFEGSDHDWAWFDEPPSEKIYRAVWRGLTDRGGLLFMTATPLASPWMFKEAQKIKADPNGVAKIIEFKPYCNVKNIGEGDEVLGRKRLDELYSQYDEQELKARRDGQFIQLHGLIFQGWDRQKHLIAPFHIPKHWQIIESIDPHPSKPWAVTWTALAPNGAKLLLRSLYAVGGIDEVADQILYARAQLPIEQGLQPKVVRCLIDNASSVPTWSRSFTDPTARRISVREELNNLIGPKGGGPQVEVAPKNVQGKIDLFKRWLVERPRNGKTRPDFYVMDNDENELFVNEIEQYAWARFKAGDNEGDFKMQPIKKNDDLMDSVLQVALTLGSGDTSSGQQEMNFTDSSWEGYGRRGNVSRRVASKDFN